MSSTTYKIQLSNAFNQMKNSNDGNKIFANAIITNLTNWLSSCTMNTSDVGSYNVSYTYSGTGDKMSYTINDTSSMLYQDLENKNSLRTNKDIATKIINRCKEAVEQGNIIITTSGMAVMGQSTIPVTKYPSSSSSIHTSASQLAIIQLANDFENSISDDSIARAITNAIKILLKSITFTVTYTGLLNGSGTSTTVNIT